MSGRQVGSEQQHDYTARIQWTGNTGKGTSSYRAYQRSWDVTTPGKPIVHCSNDPLLGGDPTLHNPEDLLLASVSSCHMLWYLHLASSQGVVIQSYVDNPIGTGEISPNGAGRFLSVTLHPTIGLAADTDTNKADAIHGLIHQYCFIARSLNFPVDVAARYETSAQPDV